MRRLPGKPLRYFYALVCVATAQVSFLDGLFRWARRKLIENMMHERA